MSETVIPVEAVEAASSDPMTPADVRVAWIDADRQCKFLEARVKAGRLEYSQPLAQWEAHRDALEDDGGYAMPKGEE